MALFLFVLGSNKLLNNVYNAYELIPVEQSAYSRDEVTLVRGRETPDSHHSALAEICVTCSLQRSSYFVEDTENEWSHCPGDTRWLRTSGLLFHPPPVDPLHFISSLTHR